MGKILQSYETPPHLHTSTPPHKHFLTILLVLIAISLSAQWTGLMPNPLYTTTQLVGIGTNSPEMKLHIQSEDQEFYSDFQSSLMQDIRHIRLSYLKRSNSNGIMLPGSGNAMSIIEDYDWDIKNENGLLSFGLTENLSSTSYNVFALTQTEAWVRKNLTVDGNTSLNGLTATNINTDNLTTNNLSVNNITSSKLSIGAKKPTGAYANYALSVDGSIVSKKEIVQMTSWADKVFDKKYPLMPLAEIEQFITTNKHLPEIPSEKEILKNGVDVGEMNKLLLQKVEELTLHLIEQEKKIKSLEAKVEKK